MFHYGIEHEVAFLDNAGNFADFSRTKFADFNQIVERLPIYKEDYPDLRIGDAGIKEKRWYIEGLLTQKKLSNAYLKESKSEQL